MRRKEVEIRTEKQFISLKAMIQDFLKEEKGIGLLHIFVAHTTCAIKIMEGEILLLSDVNAYLEKLFPADGTYRHDFIGIRDVPLTERINGYSHMRQLFFDCQVTIPTLDGKMLLGVWQDVFLVEFDPVRDRKVIFTYYSEDAGFCSA